MINKKFVAAFVAALALTVSVSTVNADTISDLQAQIAALTAQLSALSGGSSMSATFNTNLTVGSTGADVTSLQNWLISKGFSIPAGATGYFGAQTQSALAAYQSSVGISPAAGYFGPITRAKLNAGGVTTTTGGTTVGGTTTTGGSTITTPGVEGTLTVDQGAISNTTVYEGQTSVPVLNLRLRALTSDISVQRVQVNLGTSATVYAKAFSQIEVVGDNGTVLASVPLNQSTVTKSGSNYFVTITGFNYLVSKNQYRYLTVNADVFGSVDTAYQGNYTFTLPDQGIRGEDGAGIDEYTSGAISQTVTINPSLSDSADLKLSQNASTPLTGAVIANGGSLNDEADKVTVLVFNIKAEKDSIGVTDILASTTINGAGNNASTTSAYLYDGSTLVASAAVGSNGTIAFNNISGVQGYVIPQDTTKAFTLKVDLRAQGTNPGTLVATVLSNGISAVNSEGVNVTNISGSATSNNLYAQKAGPLFTLLGTPSISKSVIGQTASSTFSTGFTFNLTSQGTDVNIASTSAFVIGIYVNNTRVATTSATYAKPTSGISLNGNGSYTISDGSTATFTAQTSFVGPQAPYLPAGGIVTARLESVTWNTSNVSTYISDTFRTDSSATVTL